MPIFVLFALELGLNYTQVLFCFSAISLGQIVFEVPSGVFADFYGRKKTLAIGGVFRFLAMALVYTASGFWQLLLGNLFVGAAFACYSGTDSSLIYDTLKSLKRETTYKRVEGNARSLSLASMAITSLLGGFIAGVFGFRATFFATMLFSPLISIASLLMEEPPLTKEVDDRNYFRHLKDSINFSSGHKRIRWLTGYGALLVAIMLSSHQLLQPYLTLAQIPVSSFGAIYVVWLMVCSAAANYADRFESYFGDRLTLVLMPLLAGAGILFLGFYTGIAGVFAYFLTEVAYGLNTPILSSYIHDHVPSQRRATVMSLVGFAKNIAFLIMGPFFGAIVDNFSLGTAFFLEGVFAVLLAFIALKA